MIEGGYDVVAIGASAGGLSAVCVLLSLLPANFEIPIAIVQHRAKESMALAEVVQDCTKLRVMEIEDKQPLEPHSVYIAPPDYHLLIDDGRFALSTEDLVRFSRPSIDVFFDSAADAYGAGVIGVVLTGANSDGSKGLKKIAARGGQALVQDPETAEIQVMPAAAMKAVRNARVMSLEEIAEHLIQLEQLHRQQVAKQS
jgi:two-component system, chemotaxis family, protein-glutamate methylesterase/glutaminase